MALKSSSSTSSTKGRRLSIDKFLQNGQGDAKSKWSQLRNARSVTSLRGRKTTEVKALPFNSNNGNISGNETDTTEKNKKAESRRQKDKDSNVSHMQSDRLSVPSQFKGKFTDSQITSFQEVFTFYDKDASGNIDRDELASVLQTLGEDVTDAKLDEMVSEVDQDGDGEVSWAEFLHVMTLSKVSLFKGVTERLDKKLNPLKVGDDVVMSQGGVKIRGVLQQKVGMFWTVRLKNGAMAEGIAPSCLLRAWINSTESLSTTLSGPKMIEHNDEEDVTIDQRQSAAQLLSWPSPPSSSLSPSEDDKAGKKNSKSSTENGVILKMKMSRSSIISFGSPESLSPKSPRGPKP